MSIHHPVPCPAAGAASPVTLRPAVAWYGVAVLFTVQIFSFVDRQALSLLIAPIKADLGMSDTEVSLVIGLGFAFAYAVAGLPIGRLVDRISRPALLSAGLALSLASTVFALLTDRAFGDEAVLWRALAVGAPTLAALTGLNAYRTCVAANAGETPLSPAPRARPGTALATGV